MTVPKTTRVIINANPPIGEIKPDTFAVEERDIAELQDGEILVKVLAFGNEPAQRGWLDGDKDEKRMYAPLIKKGDAVRAPILGEIAATRSPKWKEGDRITSFGTWSEYVTLKGDNPAVQPAVQIPGNSEWLSLGPLGLTGRTAWVGVYDICKIQKEHTVLVSAAAGSVGSIVVQIAKHVIGCKKVVGIAGGKEKCEWVKSIGADDCIDYKDEKFGDNLRAALPDYADIFFDNVGGQVLNEAFTVVKRYGFIGVCGSISGYHGQDVNNLTNWFEVISNRINIKGFILSDHLDKLGEASKDLAQWIKDGKIKFEKDAETVVPTKFEDVPKTWQKLFTGESKGKLITKLEG